LDEVRESLHASGGTRAEFVQSFKPAGFDSTDQESGRVALDLPRCLRWDYEEPFPKSLLLCDEMVYTWAPDDSAGRRYQVDPKNEPGLDLLLLSTDDLRQRYRATSRAVRDSRNTTGERVEILLEPMSEKAGLRSAKLIVNPKINRLVGLEYVDLEGGTTSFEISGYRPIQEEGTLATTFTPPADLRWSEE